jgi:hypothetical protein
MLATGVSRRHHAFPEVSGQDFQYLVGVGVDVVVREP